MSVKSIIGLRATTTPTDGVMRYAVALPADQTFTYLRGLDDEGTEYGETTVHAEATLWTDLGEAEFHARAVDGWVDEVADVTEFRARPDTW